MLFGHLKKAELKVLKRLLKDHFDLKKSRVGNVYTFELIFCGEIVYTLNLDVSDTKDDGQKTNN